ncbi:MAG: MFS transporter [Spirochaetes bacterium]|nr:MFS transporter [Spirochaetota bacterium]
MVKASGTVGFIAAQPRNWKVTAARASLDKLIYQMVFPYLGVYIVGLGASGAGLGLANGVGMALSALYGLAGVAFMRRAGLKKIYLDGLAVVALSYLLLGLSSGWALGMSGIVAWWWGNAETGLCCNVVCGTSLENRTRAAAMGACESVAQGTMSFLGPAVGAALAGLFGGLGTGSIRPLFFLAFAGELGCLWFVRRNLGDRADKAPVSLAATAAETKASSKAPATTGRNLLRTASLSFLPLKRDRRLWKFVAVSCLTNLPLGMVFPFCQLFASQATSASPYILAAMVTGSAFVSLLAGLPIGRLADRIGRKKTLYALAPLFLASNLLLVFGKTPFLLIASGICLGVFPVTQVVTAAMGFEQVPPEEIGDWMAILRFFKLLLGALLTIAAGLIWDSFGGRWVFLLAAGIDLFVRIPLLASIPETLEKKA